MNYGELKKILKKAGCFKKREGKRHEIWQSPSGNTFEVGRHNQEEVATGTLNKIMKDAGLK